MRRIFLWGVFGGGGGDMSGGVVCLCVCLMAGGRIKTLDLFI
jgi:hypothetical protein